VGSFTTTVYATCKNAAGADFYYHEKRVLTAPENCP